MRYDVKLSGDEIAALASLIGQPLERVLDYSWAIDLQTASTYLAVVPKEVATPDADHPWGDVERPEIKVAEPGTGEPSSILGEGLGLVRAVNVISILVGFSPVVDCPPQELLPGVVLPASKGYGLVYYPPEQPQLAELEVEHGALVDLDIAFEVVTDVCPTDSSLMNGPCKGAVRRFALLHQFRTSQTSPSTPDCQPGRPGMPAGPGLS